MARTIQAHGRWATCMGVLLLAALPWVEASHSLLNLLSQVGIAVLVCASYGLLLGHSGMLSFGHAVHPALGAYAVIYLLRGLEGWGLGSPVAVALLPLCGGLAAMAAAGLLGWPQVRRAGTVFGMVTLGVGELFYAMAQAFPALSGGENGLGANRVLGAPVLGVQWATEREMYALVLLYLLLGLALYRGVLASVPGRLLHAVRDNAMRLAFTGVNPVGLRYFAFLASAFLAGVAGGLGALLFEIVTPEVFSAHRSAQYLVFSVLGGTGSLLGAALGGVLMVGTTVWLSTLTGAWMFYTGLAFCLAVLAAPGGLAQAWPALRGAWREPRAWARSLVLAVAGLALVVVVELAYHHFNQAQVSAQFHLLGLPFSSHNLVDLAGAVVLLGVSLVLWWRLFNQAEARA